MIECIDIKINHLKKQFAKTSALSDISLYFEGGKMHGVIGPEGAGKTTLMRIILGLLQPSAGNVEFWQNDKIMPLKYIRHKIAYMPQQQSLYPDLSIEEHLEFFRKLYQIEINAYKARRAELLRITKLAPFLKRTAAQLSGGMYKKLGLMCALLRSPEIILLDEPTNGVDPISRRELWELLYRFSEQKILILVTTAYMDEAERCAKVHLLGSGKLVLAGEPKELLIKEKVKNFDELFLKYEKVLS